MNITPREFCDIHDACLEGARFARKYETMADVWDNCPRADWLIWIMHRIDQETDLNTLRLFACWCVRNTPIGNGRKVWHLLTDERSRNAVVVAEQFARGEVDDAVRAAAWDAARDAARVAVGAAAWAAAFTAGERPWAGALSAADDAAVEAPGAAALAVAQKAQADHFRTLFSNPFRKEGAA